MRTQNYYYLIHCIINLTKADSTYSISLKIVFYFPLYFYPFRCVSLPGPAVSLLLQLVVSRDRATPFVFLQWASQIFFSFFSHSVSSADKTVSSATTNESQDFPRANRI